MRFEKVTYEQFERDFEQAFWSKNLDMALGYPKETDVYRIAKEVHSKLELPKRGTIGSAGYDFTFPVDILIPEHKTIMIPTGIKWDANNIDHIRLAMNIYPRSGIGTTYKVREPNVVSVIDSDYYNCAKNEGHIFINLVNEGNNGPCFISANEGYAQGVIYQYFITDDDQTTSVRTGGFGSTNK